MKKAVCVNNQGFEASLMLHKEYFFEQVQNLDSLNMIKVIDESGAFYIYSKDMFELPYKTNF